MPGLAIDTFGDMIALALRNAGVIGQGQTAGAEDTTNAAQLLNAMLGQWQRRRYLVYHLVEQTFTCAGAQFYTVGPAGNFPVASRPAEINYAFARQVINAQPNQIDYPIEILPARETYAQVQMKSLISFPRWAWYDADFPLGKLYLYPVVTSQFELHIGYSALLQTVTSLTDPITMPPEYVYALLYNLAVMLAGAYQLAPSPVVVGLAKSSLATMRSVNAQVPRMNMPRFLQQQGGKYSIYGDYTY